MRADLARPCSRLHRRPGSCCSSIAAAQRQTPVQLMLCSSPTDPWSRRHRHPGSCCSSAPCRGAAPRCPHRPGCALREARRSKRVISEFGKQQGGRARRQPLQPPRTWGRPMGRQPCACCAACVCCCTCIAAAAAAAALPPALLTRQGGIGVEGGALVRVLAIAQALQPAKDTGGHGCVLQITAGNSLHGRTDPPASTGQQDMETWHHTAPTNPLADCPLAN